MSRTKEAISNYAVSMFGEFIIFILGLISRAIFVRKIGIFYLGISSLFTTVIGILSLTSLGIGDALVYVLVKAFAKDEKQTIQGVYNYAKKIYFYIAIIISGIAFAIVPLLSFFVKDFHTLDDGYLIYFVYVFSVLLSYIAGPYSAVYKADQKYRMIKKGELIGYCLSTILQIIVMLINSSFKLYILISLFNNIFSVLYMRKHFVKDYPDVINSKEKIPKEEKHSIFVRVKDVLITRLSTVAVVSTDNLLISRFVGVDMLGKYNNYTVMTNNVRILTKNLYYSMESGVGSLFVKSNTKEINEIYKRQLLGFHMISTILTSCVFLLMQDFVEIWVGVDNLLDNGLLVIICMDLYINMIMYAQSFAINMTDIFGKIKTVYFWGAIYNIILSIILCIQFGLCGILLGTLISKLTCNFFVGLLVIYKYLLKRTLIEGIAINLYYMFQCFFIVLVVKLIANIVIADTIWLLIIKGIIVFSASAILTILCNIKNKDMVYFKEKIKKIIHYKSV